MNVEALTELVEFLGRLEDDEVDMGMWYSGPQDDLPAQHTQAPHCGTAACAAGWAVALDAGHHGWEVVSLDRIGAKMGNWTQFGYRTPDGLVGFGSISNHARALLGLQSNALFYLDDWPREYVHRVDEGESYRVVLIDLVQDLLAFGEDAVIGMVDDPAEDDDDQDDEDDEDDDDEED
jgi:hypothetical protein